MNNNIGYEGPGEHPSAAGWWKRCNKCGERYDASEVGSDTLCPDCLDEENERDGIDDEDTPFDSPDVDEQREDDIQMKAMSAAMDAIHAALMRPGKEA